MNKQEALALLKTKPYNECPGEAIQIAIDALEREINRPTISAKELLHPDENQLRIRDEIENKTKNWHIIVDESGWTVNIPELNLDDLIKD